MIETLVENSMVEQEIHKARLGFVGEMVRKAPNGIVSVIATESIPEGTKASRYYGGDFKKRGLQPQGETLEMVREVLLKAPDKKEDNTTRAVDLTSVTPDILLPEEAARMFAVEPGRGLQVTVDGLIAAGITKQLYDLLNFRADNLLVALYAAGSTSIMDRQTGASRPKNIDVRYPHSNGEVTVIRIRSDVAGQLTRVVEDAIVANRGKL